MKIKQLPEDFVVQEQTDLEPGSAGEFALYCLKKVGWTTPDALSVVRRRWQIPPQRMSYGGLKDRHAETFQHITIYRGPAKNLNHQRLTLDYLGQIAEPFTAQHIRANQFQITARGLTQREESQARASLPSATTLGVPNYFDDQRFGSVGADRRFIAAELVHGRFEIALKLALAEPYEHDRSADKQIKSILRSHWNNWAECKTALPRSSARSIVDYLVHHPTDYKGAFVRLKPELTSLYLAAYQSDLWNRMVATWLRKVCPPEQLGLLPAKLGAMPLPRQMAPEFVTSWESLSFPLPSARIKSQPESIWYASLLPVLLEEGLTLEGLRVRGMQKPYFSRGERSICLKPHGLKYSFEADELNAGRRKLRLEFELPRGAYATMLVKGILQSQ